jgi:hypothetical protein
MRTLGRIVACSLRQVSRPLVPRASHPDPPADLALSQMSKLQRSQLDKDGDGKLSHWELARQGFSSKYTSPTTNTAAKTVLTPESPSTEEAPRRLEEKKTSISASVQRNLFANRQPELFSGSGASLWGGPETIPRSREKAPMPSKAEKPPPVGGYGMASEAQVGFHPPLSFRCALLAAICGPADP